jgi:hypothetical protein
VPEIVFQTEPQIALDQLRAARAAGIAADIVLADAGYGNDTDFRDGSPGLALPMPSASCPASNGAGADARHRRSVVIASISRSLPRNWRRNYLRKPGGG